MKMLAKTLFLSLALGAMTTSAMAQGASGGGQPETKQPGGERGPGERGPRGPQGPGGQGRGMGQDLSPEKAQAAWELQAKGVAGRLSLPSDQATALSRAYVEARTTMRSKMEEVRKQRAEGGSDANPMETMRAAEADVKKTFEKSLTDAKISEANIAKINTSLGSPVGLNGRPWDRAVDALAGLKLEPAKQQTALNAIEDHMVSMSKTMESMRGGSGDPESARKSMQEAREKLNTELKTVMTEEQLKTFEQNAGMMGRGRPGGDRPDGGRPQDGEKKDGGDHKDNGKGEPKKK